MEHWIFQTGGQQPFDAVPAYKIVFYPGAQDGYKPFAQCQLLLAGDQLLARLWAFEVRPEPGSSLQLCLQPAPGRSLCVGFSAGGEAWCFADGAPAPLPGPVAPLGGEDLQGVYWGGMVHLPLAGCRALFGPQALQQPVVMANAYKLLQEGQRPHLGGLFPFDPRRALWAPGQLGAFSRAAF